MQTLVALLVVTAAACAIARPPGSTLPVEAAKIPRDDASPPLPPPVYLNPYYMSPLMNYQGYEESPRIPVMPNHDWLNKEIEHINQMEETEDALNPYEAELTQWISQDPYIRRIIEVPVNKNSISEISPETLSSNTENLKILEPTYMAIDNAPPAPIVDLTQLKSKVNHPDTDESNDHKKEFALTPRDKGYYDDLSNEQTQNAVVEILPPSNSPPRAAAPIFGPPRQIRQNPNLSRTKTLVAENLDKLRAGLPNEDRVATSQTHDYHVSETGPSGASSMYGIAFIALLLASVTISVIVLVVWYTLSKRAKAAADVDYPAYGVTGPTIESSGDRKLAHSAHMYHYQHQKQQIIAMERSDLELRNGSVSDPESEEENEEGDYTVYECPGFATTGDMEVKNPLFSDDPTPATPGKCEVVKPQPKE